MMVQVITPHCPYPLVPSKADSQLLSSHRYKIPLTRFRPPFFYFSRTIYSDLIIAGVSETKEIDISHPALALFRLRSAFLRFFHNPCFLTEALNKDLLMTNKLKDLPAHSTRISTAQHLLNDTHSARPIINRKERSRHGLISRWLSLVSA